MIISSFLILFGRFLIVTLFSEEFLSAYTPLLILLIGYSIYSVLVCVGRTLSSVGKVNMVFKISVICAFMNTLLNLILIPRYGLLGASFATSTSLIITVLINFYFINEHAFKLMKGNVYAVKLD